MWGSWKNIWFGSITRQLSTASYSVYSKAELTVLPRVCRTHKLPLFLNRTRLGYGLMSRETDMALADIAVLRNVSYIGGAKVGVPGGEAVVFTRNNRLPHIEFLRSVWQAGQPATEFAAQTDSFSRIIYPSFTSFSGSDGSSSRANSSSAALAPLSS